MLWPRTQLQAPVAQTAVLLGPTNMVAGTRAWGLDEEIPIDLPRPAASTFGDTTDLDQNLPLLAIRGFGQNEDQMVPLHMAMVAAAIANGGRMMKPYVVEATFDHQQRQLERTQPSVWKTPLSPENAAILTDLMIGVAESGTASCCIGLEGGIPVAAKTGTADLGLGTDVDLVHAWITAFAPADDPKYAIAVVLTNLESTPAEAATGGRLAGPAPGRPRLPAHRRRCRVTPWRVSRCGPRQFPMWGDGHRRLPVGSIERRLITGSGRGIQ